MAMILMVFLVLSLFFGREEETHAQGSVVTAQDFALAAEEQEEVGDV